MTLPFSLESINLFLISQVSSMKGRLFRFAPKWCLGPHSLVYIRNGSESFRSRGVPLATLDTKCPFNSKETTCPFWAVKQQRKTLQAFPYWGFSSLNVWGTCLRWLKCGGLCAYGWYRREHMTKALHFSVSWSQDVSISDVITYFMKIHILLTAHLYLS